MRRVDRWTLARTSIRPRWARVGLLAVLLFTTLFTPLATAGVGLGRASAHAPLPAPQGKPNRFDPTTQASSTLHRPKVAGGPTTYTGPAKPIRHGGPLPMRPGWVALDSIELDPSAG